MDMIGQKIAEQVKSYCTKIGADPMLVQGPGGNVSWKDGDVLWIKASGAWLAHASSKEIFIPVDLAHLRLEIANLNFSVAPKVLNDSRMRPSIETLMHALMPHKVVVHLHAVEILAYLVRTNPLKDFEKLICNNIKWTLVDYFSPGADLAKAVFENLVSSPDVDIIFLKNHGIVIGGEDVKSVERRLNLISLYLAKPVEKLSAQIEIHDSIVMIDGYIPCPDKELNQLATRNDLSLRLQAEWALCPDHIVFLGPKAEIIKDSKNLIIGDRVTHIKPPYIFVIGKGVYESLTISAAQRTQLRCYYDILIRQDVDDRLASLNSKQISHLLSLDDEKYRIHCSR
jgi:rhamnose utilization protein RhaD (predicted bifunctional aldolase and dehydrogenase)